MIAVILFQINIVTLTLFSVFLCGGRKKNYDGDGDVSLVQPGIQKSSGSGGMPMLTASSSASRPMNDDFSVGVPPPHIPLADKSDERTLADIESIQSEKAMIREKKSKLAAANSKGKLPNAQSPAAPPTGSASAEGSKVMKGSRSPAR
ncbi:unnamed protein product [Caenorhabditis brenneri]